MNPFGRVGLANGTIPKDMVWRVAGRAGGLEYSHFGHSFVLRISNFLTEKAGFRSSTNYTV